jgi:hypothetical protein
MLRRNPPEEAKRHVAEGRAVREQEGIIAELERDGLDATEATRPK